MLRLRLLEPDDWREWRALRQAALGEAPVAFGSTLAEWTGTGDTEQRWRNRLASVAANVVAEDDGGPVGMVSVTAAVDGLAELISMWVSPATRGRGVGDALVEAAVAQARSQGASRIALDVAADNLHAIALYARAGFVDVGRAEVTEGERPERRMLRIL